MTAWRFCAYVSTNHEHLFEDWYSAQAPDVRAECEATFTILRQTDDWEEPQIEQFRRLTKKPADNGLGEVRWYVDIPRPKKHPTRVRYRAFGIYVPSDREFVLLTGAHEWMRGYMPSDALPVARLQKTRFEQGLGWTYERT